LGEIREGGEGRHSKGKKKGGKSARLQGGRAGTFWRYPKRVPGWRSSHWKRLRSEGGGEGKVGGEEEKGREGKRVGAVRGHYLAIGCAALAMLRNVEIERGTSEGPGEIPTS